MPISPIDGLSSEHWLEVLGIIKEVAINEGFDANLVSVADESGIIQQRIIQNLYNNDIVICDVSGKNPNVMFELGMRLAFDKATIVIKDDSTDYSFDTSPIEHLDYPRDLRFTKILRFKEALAVKIKATYLKSKEANYSTFLKHFGTFNVQTLKEKEGGLNDFIINAVEGLKAEISSLRKMQSIKARATLTDEELRNYVDAEIDKFAQSNNIDRSKIFTKEILDSLKKQVLLYTISNGYSISAEQLNKAFKDQLPF